MPWDLHLIDSNIEFSSIEIHLHLIDSNVEFSSIEILCLYNFYSIPLRQATGQCPSLIKK